MKGEMNRSFFRYLHTLTTIRWMQYRVGIRRFAALCITLFQGGAIRIKRTRLWQFRGSLAHAIEARSYRHMFCTLDM